MTKSTKQNNRTCTVAGLLVACLMALPSPSVASELQPQTLAAWQQYLQIAETNMKARLVPAKHFLWVDETPSRSLEVKQGKIVVEPLIDSGMQVVPGGLIHDWIGAAFIPNTTIDHLQSVISDYNRYKEIYGPNVVASRCLGHSELGHDQCIDRLSLRIVNKMSILTAAIDTEYQVQNFRPDCHHAYSVAQSTKVQQIRNYGKANQVELLPGQGDGFIWELCSISRYEEKDGGVYVELEALALTRDIPNSLRWLLKPLAARMSRKSMLLSLGQTIRAVPPGEIAGREISSNEDSIRSRQ